MSSGRPFQDLKVLEKKEKFKTTGSYYSLKTVKFETVQKGKIKHSDAILPQNSLILERKSTDHKVAVWDTKGSLAAFSPTCKIFNRDSKSELRF